MSTKASVEFSAKVTLDIDFFENEQVAQCKVPG